MAWNQWKDSGEQKEQDQRSQRLTLREHNCDKTRGIKVDTKTQKFKSQYVSSANWRKVKMTQRRTKLMYLFGFSLQTSQECLQKFHPELGKTK